MFSSRVRSNAASEEAALLINMIGQVGDGKDKKRNKHIVGAVRLRRGQRVA